MTTRPLLFDSPFLLGFDHTRALIERAAKAAGEPYHLAVDNRMVVPVGRQVKLIITGADVIHSFAVPAFWTKMDAVPGRANETTFTATKVGVYYRSEARNIGQASR